jgi:class 3 adenylate cyclase
MAVLFGDLPRFSALDDSGLATFYEGPLAAMGAALDRHPAAYRNAWGDAVQIAFDEVPAAAACAFDMRAALAAQTPPIHPRFAIDFGPLLPVHDAVQRAEKYSGRAMTRAARIEPVTPPGRIFATEAFACEVALLPRSAGLASDYAGRIPTAKGFGSLPLYALRRSGAEEELA